MRVWQNSDRTPSQIVMYTKKIDGTYYAAIAVPISNAKNIQVISAYINKHKKIEAPELVNMDKSPHPTSKTFDPSASIEIITSGEKEGNTKYSLCDNKGRKLTKEQQEHFKDSKVRDENGNLLTVYHGSKNKFNVFTSDINWFSSSKEYSNNYGKKANLFNKVTKREPKKSKVTFETYLNIKNPKELGDIGGYINQQFDIDELHLPQEDIDNLIKSYEESEGKAPYRVWELVNSKVFKDYLISKGYDGITAKEFGNTTYGAFYPEQTKDVDNTNPTSNPDIKYSLSAPVNKIPLGQRVSGDALLDAQDTLDLAREVGGKTDNNGYVTLYHRTSEENAEKIKRTGKMSAKEDGIFFVPDDILKAKHILRFLPHLKVSPVKSKDMKKPWKTKLGHSIYCKNRIDANEKRLPISQSKAA